MNVEAPKQENQPHFDITIGFSDIVHMCEFKGHAIIVHKGGKPVNEAIYSSLSYSSNQKSKSTQTSVCISYTSDSIYSDLV